VLGPRRLRGAKQMYKNADAACEKWCPCCLPKLLEGLEKARPVLVQLEYQVNREQASMQLAKAVAADNIENIHDAISEGLECEVDDAELVTANERITFLAERARATAELTVAMAGEDLIFLQWAIKAAEFQASRQQSVEEVEIAHAKLLETARRCFKTLADDARKAEMFKIKNASVLRSAMFRSGKLAFESVASATHTVHDAGFGMKVVHASTGAAPVSKRHGVDATTKAAARKTLLASVGTDTTAEMLDTAVREGAQAGLPPAELSTAFRTNRLAAAKELNVEIRAKRKAEAETQLRPLVSSFDFLHDDEDGEYMYDSTEEFMPAFDETRIDPRSSMFVCTSIKSTGASGLRPDRTIDPRKGAKATKEIGQLIRKKVHMEKIHMEKEEASSTGSRTCCMM
jgi:hypothetical protein